MLDEVPQRSEWRGIVVRTLVAVFILAGVFLAVSWWLGQRVPNGTTVAGVDVSNLTQEDARDTLERRLEPMSQVPITVTAGDEQYQVTPEEAGFSVDVEATLDGLTGVSYNPVDLWDQVTGAGSDRDLVVRTDRAAATAQVEEMAEDFDVAAQDAGVAIERESFVVTDAVTGRAIDVPSTTERLLGAWPGEEEVEARTTEVPPELQQDVIDAFLEENQVALSAPVRLQVVEGEETVFADLQPTQLARLLRIEEGEQGPVLRVDHESLVEVSRQVLADAERAPVDAGIQFEDGEPAVVPARGGRQVDESSVIEAFSEALRRPEGERRADVGLDVVAADFSTDDAEALGVSEVTGEYTGTMPDGDPNEPRTANIIRGAAAINGTLVRPGDTFSLYETLAPITTANGYSDAGVIVDGRLVDGVGGGLSQLSTAVLNAAWFNGVQLDTFTRHAYYIPRYPEGREATLAGAAVDNRWTNDTDYGIFVQAFTEGDQITVRFWSTEVYEVESDTGPRRNVVPPQTRQDDSADCLPQTPMEGFDVSNRRVVREGGEVIKDETYETRYVPSDNVTCTGGG